MANVRVKQCDACKTLDTEDMPVTRVKVVGPRFDLCPACQVAILLPLIGDEEAVAAILTGQMAPEGTDTPEEGVEPATASE